MISSRARRERLAAGLEVIDEQIAGRHGPILTRRYSADRSSDDSAQVVWVHGGGFARGNLDVLESHAVACALARAGHTTFTVDYRRVPMWNPFRAPRPGPLPGIRYPIPMDDVTDAYEHIRDQVSGNRAVLGGASAGACLAAAATLRLVTDGKAPPESLILAYGTFHALLPPVSPELRSRTGGRHALTMQLSPTAVERMNRNYAGSLQSSAEAFAFPGGHDLHGLPPTLMIDADRDNLRSSGEQFARELRQAGVLVDHRVIPESKHAFLNTPDRPAFTIGVAAMVHYLAAARPPDQAMPPDRS